MGFGYLVFHFVNSYRDLGMADDLNYVSVTRVKYLMELHGKKVEAQHSEEKSGFPDLEFDGKKSTTAVGKYELCIIIRFYLYLFKHLK